MDQNASENIVTFYSDFSKAFDKVPHKELLIKVGQIGVGGCFLEVLVDYLHNRRQFVRADNTSSRILEITSGVPQGSLLGPLLFCILINDLPDVLRFSDSYLFADDLKILLIGYIDTKFQDDINAVQNWVATNKMELAFDKCAILNIRGPEKDFELLYQYLNSLQAVKDLGINVKKNELVGSYKWKQIQKSKQSPLFDKEEHRLCRKTLHKTGIIQIADSASPVIWNQLYHALKI